MKNKLEWYAMKYDFNQKEIIQFNVFNSCIIEDLLQEIKRRKVTSRQGVREALRIELMYYYHYKREYEISVGDLDETDLTKYEKIDVYTQLIPNLDVMTDYVINKLGISFGKKTKLKERIENVTSTKYDFAKEKNLIIEDLLNIIDHQNENIKDLEMALNEERLNK